MKMKNFVEIKEHGPGQNINSKSYLEYHYNLFKRLK
jgi:hypothetical protein